MKRIIDIEMSLHVEYGVKTDEKNEFGYEWRAETIVDKALSTIEPTGP